MCEKERASEFVSVAERIEREMGKRENERYMNESDFIERESERT